MIPQTLKNWFPRWLKEWLLPKVGQASAVIIISRVIFSIDDEIWFTGQAKKNFEAIYEKVNNPIFLYIIYFTSFLFIVSLSLRAWRKGRSLTLLKFERSSSLIGKGLNGLIGLLLVPLVVAISWAYFSKTGVTPQLKDEIYKFGVAFLLIGAAFDWLSGEDESPPHHITYRLVANAEKSIEIATYETSERLREVLSHIDLLSDPVVVCHSKDNEITLVIPLISHAKTWTARDIESLRIFLDAIELEWKTESGWKFVRFLPTELQLNKPS